MSFLELLKNRAGLLVSGAASIMAVVGGVRLVAGEPLVQSQIDVGIVVGIAMAALFLVVDDTRGEAEP